MRIHHLAAIIALSSVGLSAQTPPKRTGASILALLASTKDGNALLAKAGLSGEQPVQAGAPSGWSATFDIPEDFSKTLDHSVSVGTHNVDVSTSVTTAAVSQIGTKMVIQLAKTSGASIPGTAMVTYDNLPAGKYAVAIDLSHATAGVAASVTLPSGATPCPPLLLAKSDAGFNTCAFIYTQAKAGMLQFTLSATSGTFNLAGVTVSRVAP